MMSFTIKAKKSKTYKKSYNSRTKKDIRKEYRESINIYNKSK
jgi:hypothetical protein